MHRHMPHFRPGLHSTQARPYPSPSTHPVHEISPLTPPQAVSCLLPHPIRLLSCISPLPSDSPEALRRPRHALGFGIKPPHRGIQQPPRLLCLVPLADESEGKSLVFLPEYARSHSRRKQSVRPLYELGDRVHQLSSILSPNTPASANAQRCAISGETMVERCGDCCDMEEHSCSHALKPQLKTKLQVGKAQRKDKKCTVLMNTITSSTLSPVWRTKSTAFSRSLFCKGRPRSRPQRCKHVNGYFPHTVHEIREWRLMRPARVQASHPITIVLA
jgi:hypothetical protein